MKKKRKDNSGNDKGVDQLKKIESPIKKEEIKKIVVNPYQEPTRLYYSSPCLLSEIEDDEDVLKR